MRETGTVESPPKEQWREFLAVFCRQHRGSLARLEVPEAGGEHVAARDLPFMGADLDARSRRLWIQLGAGPSRLLHPVDDPGRFSVFSDASGAEWTLEIASPAGMTRVRFRSSLPTLMVDRD